MRAVFLGNGILYFGNADTGDAILYTKECSDRLAPIMKVVGVGGMYTMGVSLGRKGNALKGGWAKVLPRKHQTAFFYTKECCSALVSIMKVVAFKGGYPIGVSLGGQR